jgi:hypothetical protein
MRINALFHVKASGAYIYHFPINGQMEHNYCAVSFKYFCNCLTPLPRVSRTKTEAASELVHIVPTLKTIQISQLLFLISHSGVLRLNFMFK